MSVKWEDATELLAHQVLGVVDADSKKLAGKAMEFALIRVQQRTQLISTEKKDTLTLTTANEYSIKNDLKKTDVFRFAKFYTADGPLEVMAHELFVTLHPTWRDEASGIPSHAVFWGDDTVILWPSSSGTTLYYSYWTVLGKNDAQKVLANLIDVARLYLERGDGEVRLSNYQLAKDAVQDAQRGNARTTSKPLRILPEGNVRTMNSWKGRRRRR